MAIESKIEWTDASWSPVVGCSKISDGCRNCYAINHAWRLAHNPNKKVSSVYEGLTSKYYDSVNWTGTVKELPERLFWPTKIKKPTRIFVNPMSDLFHDDVSESFIFEIFEVMASCPRHTFQILTKRPERMKEVLNGFASEFTRIYPKIEWPLYNVWLGTTVEDQYQADRRIWDLVLTPAIVRFISCEPLLGPIDLENIEPSKMSGRLTFNSLTGKGIDKMSPLQSIPNCYVGKIDWVIVGGESGSRARPMEEDWVRAIVGACEYNEVKVFYKQKLENKKKISLPLLDGRQWVEIPGMEAR